MTSLRAFSLSLNMTILVLLTCMFSFGCAEKGGEGTMSGRGEIPAEGQTYEGGDRIYLSSGGVSLTIPQGFLGKGNASQFTIGKQEWTGGLQISTAQIDLSSAERELQQSFTNEAGTFTPDGALASDSDSSTMDYKVSGANTGSGTITTVYGEYGHTAIVLGAGTKEFFSEIQEASDAIVGSIAFSDSSATSDEGGFKSEIAGYRFTRYYTASDYTEREVYTICQDGSASWYFYASGSAAITRDETVGQWTLSSSNSSSGTVSFSWNNGQSGSETITEQSGGEFTIDGSRYFREDAGC